MTELHTHRLDIVTSCREADLQVLKIAYANLRKYVPFKQLHVATAARNFRRFERALGRDVHLIDEDSIIPGMTLAELKTMPLPFFPRGAGWYYQQFLKYAFAFQNIEDDYYLIWDADTVALRPLQFFDDQGRMLLTRATEHHRPYFQTYRQLLGADARSEFSFISQHLIVQKSILREMLGKIEALHPHSRSWAWAIMENLDGAGSNLFSEYETLGHYVKNTYPERVIVRDLPWLRSGANLCHGLPSQQDLDKLGDQYAFIAFEAKDRGLRRWLAGIVRLLASRIR